MSRTVRLAGVFASLLMVATPIAAQAQSQRPMSFFVTSVGLGNGGNLGGLAGADKHCQALAAAAGAGNRTWRAYLSTTAEAGKAAVNARDRIGKGPWYNAKGALIAQNVDQLHSDKNGMGPQTSLNEKGQLIPGSGTANNKHDMVTGSNADGTASDSTCSNWTSNNVGNAMVGHHDRTSISGRPSWNSAHSLSCSQQGLTISGDGLFACFAAD